MNRSPITVHGTGRPVLLAPGAGAGSDHPFLVGLRNRLVAAGLAVASFDYPYRIAGRRMPDRTPVLIAAHREAFRETAARCGATPVLVGKSMGGRIGSHLEEAAPGWAFLGYPLLPPRGGPPRDTAHLVGIGPLLFVQGDRDALAPIATIEAIVASHRSATLHLVSGADHGFRVRGSTADEVLDQIGNAVGRWVAGLA